MCCQVRQASLRFHSYLPAFTPSAILALFLNEIVTRLPDALTVFVCLSDERQGLQRKHGCVSEADTPTTKPETIWLLDVVDVLYCTIYGRSKESVSVV